MTAFHALGARALGLSLLLAGDAPALHAQTSTDTARSRGDSSLEGQLRQRVARVVRERLRLSGEQVRRLGQVNATFEGRRRTLLAEERDARIVLRSEVQRGDNADQQRVSDALDRLFKAQRSRIDVAEEEQRELARFLTPVQRAGYLALHEQLRRRMEALRRKRDGSGPGADGMGRGSDRRRPRP